MGIKHTIATFLCVCARTLMKFTSTEFLGFVCPSLKCVLQKAIDNIVKNFV